ncbi:hypothetical protein GIB67_005712 [Kingdonia uniflora]|uniref:Uncharacterized protein n=1 Tax=Kingdonia uniflora TaxID=39325 RepID=A0A7J7KVD6_9MAGN|nr:hypothetical protein GIB67_005712 [Kingdonia uniflora]
MSPLPPPQSTTTTPMEDDEEDQAEIERSEASVTYHPCPPSHELFDIQTTVDPSYIISLIRKLLPHNVKGNVNGDGSIRGSENGDVAVSISALVDAMEITNNVIDRLSSGKESGECCEALAEEEAAWEEYGCILWDLAADKTQSEFMVDNLLLEVILASLTVSRSLRVTEISLGMLGNLACHEVPINRIVSTEGLVDTILDYFDINHIYKETNRAADHIVDLHPDEEYFEVLTNSFSNDLNTIVNEDVEGKWYYGM